MTEISEESTAAPELGTGIGQNGGLLAVLVGGALIGIVVGVVCAPQIYGALRKMGRQLRDAAAEASDTASERYREATTQAGDAVEDLHQKGRDLYGRALSVVARGADEVKEYATEAQVGLDERAAHVSRRPL